MRRLLAIAVVLIANSAVAQTWLPATFSPSAPTSFDRIRAHFGVMTAWNRESVSTVVSGSTIRTTVEFSGGHVGLPPVGIQLFTDFGPLPAGDYTYEIYLAYGGGYTELRSTQSLAVIDPPPAVSMLTDLSMSILIAGLAGIAMWSLRFGNSS